MTEQDIYAEADVVDDVIIPLLLAAGWNQKSIDDIFGGER